MNRNIALERAIGDLEVLLSKTEVGEADFQRFFEAHTCAFEALGYSSFIPHVRLRTSQGDLIPDFLVRRVDGTYEICDIKTPGERVLKRVKNRTEFYAKISTEYAGQLRCYGEFFDDRASTILFEKEYGIVVNKSPNRFLVIGRDDGIDRYELHKILKSRGMEFSIVTYDDVVRSLRWALAMNDFGEEKQYGVTINTVIQLIEPSDSPEYLFDFFEPKTGERFSMISLPNCSFRIILNNGKGREDVFSIESLGGRKCSDWHHIQFMLGANSEYSRCELRVDGVFVESREWAYNFFWRRGANYARRLIGSDYCGQNGAAIRISYFKIHNHYINLSERKIEERVCLSRLDDLGKGKVSFLTLEKHLFLSIGYWEGTKVPIGQAVEAFYDFVDPLEMSSDVLIDRGIGASGDSR
ncbi:Shedu anti-phage system protein SduA domain-containing protein [Opitutus sp. ER46]|uniref:Shedu anti-phage system protein SduA domain-containing protein n=1 Tax=Opitutus sp. ER46 TaxID=2161864 RepID=UPI001304B604|nr:Shedu anti-phage system protein SduA domain-containing protein [Opitutus sp. ER46]